MSKQVWLNNFEADLAGAVKALPVTGTPATELGYGVLQLSGAAGAVLPALTGGDWFLLTMFALVSGLETNIEIVKVTAVDTSSGSETRLTVERAQEGTTARAFAIGDKVSMRMTAGTAQHFLQKSSNLGDLPDAAAARGNIGAEPAITADTASKYWRGNKTWSDFAADVRATVLTGLSTATNAAITAADSVLAALGKLQKQITDHFGSGGAAHANAANGGAAGFMTGSDKAKLDGIAVGATANSSDAALIARSNHTGFQAISTVTGLQGALDGKSPSGHGHAISDVAALQAALDAKAPTSTPTITGLRETKAAMAANNIDLATGNVFTKTITGAATLTVSNVPATGTVATFILKLTNGGSATVTWFSGVKWPGGTAPALTAAGRDNLYFETDDGGTTWDGSFLRDVK